MFKDEEGEDKVALPHLELSQKIFHIHTFGSE